MWSKFKKIDWKKISLYIFFSTLLIGLVALICNILFKNIINFYLPTNYIFLVSIFFLFVHILFFINKNEMYYKEKMEIYFKYIFLLGLLLITINLLEFNFFKKNKIIYIITNYLYLITAGFGFLTFYFNRIKILRRVKDKNIEKQKEKEKITKFNNKFKILIQCFPG